MPQSPRIYVSLDEKTHHVLKAVARAQGTSASAVLRELATAAVPDLQAYLELVAHLGTLTEPQKRALRGELALAEGNLLVAAAEGSSKLSDAILRVRQQSERAETAHMTGHGRGGGRGASQPPVINKGAKNGEEGGQK